MSNLSAAQGDTGPISTRSSSRMGSFQRPEAFDQIQLCGQEVGEVVHSVVEEVGGDDIGCFVHLPASRSARADPRIIQPAGDGCTDPAGIVEERLVADDVHRHADQGLQRVTVVVLPQGKSVGQAQAVPLLE